MTSDKPIFGVQTVDVRRLVVSERGNDRTVFSEQELREIADSIDRIGQITPVIVRTVVGGQCRNGSHVDHPHHRSKACRDWEPALEIVAGERRTRAIRDVLARRQIVVDVRALTDDEAAEIMLAENLVRVDLDPVDEARALQRRMDETGVSVATIAKLWDRGEGYVRDRLALLTLCDDVAHLVRTGQITIRTGSAMAGLSDEGQRAAIRQGGDMSVGAFRRLCSKLLADESQGGMFDLSAFTQEEWDAHAGQYVDEAVAQESGAIPEPAKRAFAAALVGPVEIAERLGVASSTIAQWRRRYPDFPEPVVTIGAGRQTPTSAGPVGTGVWFWNDVFTWASSTGRLK